MNEDYNNIQVIDISSIKSLIKESESILNILPQDVNQYIFQQALLLRRMIWSMAAKIRHKSTVMDINIEKIESQWIRNLKAEKVPDTVIRSAKWDIAVDEKIDKAKQEYILNRLITEISALWPWIELSKHELESQKKIV